MKKIIFVGILSLMVFSSPALMAQSVYAQYEDSYLGWIKLFNAAEPQKPYTVDHHNYSVKQMATSQMMVSWLQQSYTPKASLGKAFRLVNEKLGEYNQNTKSLPQVYGALTKTYFELKKNQQNKWIPETSSNWFMQVAVNGELGDYVDILTTPDQYYFYIPGEDGFSAEQENIANLLGFPSNATIKKYIHWFQPKGIRTTLQYVVLLCKDNKAPYVQITKGEYLDKLGKAIEREFAERIEKIKRDNVNNAKSIEYFSSYEKQAYDKRLQAYRALKEKHKNSLSEKAAITEEQPGIHLENNNTDIFDEGGSKIPIYKFDPALAAQSKSDTPQWIVISWDAEGVATGNVSGTHLHESMLHNIDYDYIYNYFFYPEKVKGQPYKPLRSPSYKEAVVVTEASEASIKNNADKNVFFFEDFSTTAVGKIPIGWKSKLGFAGSSSVITNLDGLGGKWAVVADFTLTPNQIKKPFPQNFTLSFELVVAHNFTWGAKRLHFKLAKETSPGNAESFLDLGLRPGYDGRDGDVSLETKFPSPPGYSNSANSFVAPGFSNNKKNNRITVTIKKKEEMLQVFIDNTKLAEYEKAIPATHLFNALSFYSYNSGTNDKYYISNIKIIKD